MHIDENKCAMLQRHEQLTEARYFALSVYLRERFGKKVRKVPLDAGSSCPNRDGTLAHGGCVFCNPRGSGTGLVERGMDLPKQWSLWTELFRKKYKTELFWAYLQSFTNTHGPLSRLRALLEALTDLPGMVGLSLGTRPDCLDPEKVRAIAAHPAPEKWLDIGLQSSNDATLLRINRGHDFAAFARAAEIAHAHGLKVCAHVMHDLPGETTRDFLRTLTRVNALPITGVKLHNLYVARGSALEQWFDQGLYRPGTMDDYVQAVAQGLALLRPDIVVHRLNADPMPGELLAPAWAGQKRAVLAAIVDFMKTNRLRQGSHIAL